MSPEGSALALLYSKMNFDSLTREERKANFPKKIDSNPNYLVCFTPNFGRFEAHAGLIIVLIVYSEFSGLYKHSKLAIFYRKWTSTLT